MNQTAPNPYQAFEAALERYASGEISDQRFLFIVEGQGRLVHSWIEELQGVTEYRFQSLRQHQDRCLKAKQTLLQGLRMAYRAITAKDRFKLNQARNLMAQGQETLEFAQAA